MVKDSELPVLPATPMSSTGEDTYTDLTPYADRVPVLPTSTRGLSAPTVCVVVSITMVEVNIDDSLVGSFLSFFVTANL